MRALALLLGLAVAPALVAKEIRISCGAVGVEFSLCQTGASEWAKRSGHQVTVVSAPNNSNERLALFQQLLAAKSKDIDVFMLDATWMGILGNYFIDMSPALPPAEREKFFKVFVDNNTVEGELKAVPWFLDAGLLYYRKDLLAKHGRKVPRTWEELTETAKVVMDKERAKGKTMWGFVFQGRAYEGLTCNALEWIHSWGGGTVVDSQGNVTVHNPKAVQALVLAGSWVGHISPPGVLSYAEEESRGVFQSGQAVFHRNWPYVWGLANTPQSPIRGIVGVAPLPSGDRSLPPSATLGGWSLGISKLSPNREEALALVRHLTSEAEQKRRLLEGGFNPARRSIYRDPQALAANPMLEELLPVFENAVARPSRATGPKYNRVSSELWNAVHRVLSRKEPADRALADLQKRLERLRKGGKW